MEHGGEFYREIFVRLGRELELFGHTPDTRRIIDAAVEENPWFTVADIIFAVRALRSKMLSKDILEEWGTLCPATANPGKRVALIMAGNIPLAGFSDLLCVLSAGHVPCIKPSSKDRALMNYVVALLRSLSPEIEIGEYRPDEKYDAAITSGSDNAARYFRSEFAGVPSLIRGSRSSAALLRGDETEEQLRLLGRDIFLYSGLGCRNVTFLLVPDGLDIDRLGRKVMPAEGELNPKYRNNCRSVKGRMAVERVPYMDCGAFVVTFGTAFPAYLSNIVVFQYSDVAEAYGWLHDNDAALQCVVGDRIEHPRAVGFGESQLPRPWDYPDGEDVMSFLASL